MRQADEDLENDEELVNRYKETTKCPKCGGEDVHLDITIRGWLCCYKCGEYWEAKG